MASRTVSPMSLYLKNCGLILSLHPNKWFFFCNNICRNFNIVIEKKQINLKNLSFNLYTSVTHKCVHFLSVQLRRGKLCFPEAENSEFFFSFFFCLFFPQRRQQHLRRIRPDRACCSAFCLQTLEDCLVQTEFVWFFEAVQSCSGESERLQLFGTSRGSMASSTPAWHQTHSSTLRPFFCSVAS